MRRRCYEMLRSEKTRPENDWTEVARRQGREDEDGSNDLETRPNMESGASGLAHNLGAATGKFRRNQIVIRATT
jgi:hypothetical protein